jgi:hypothetical protein
MFYRIYHSPFCSYARYHIPYWPRYGYNGYYGYSSNIIGSQLQNAQQDIVNTGIMSGTSQSINQNNFI